MYLCSKNQLNMHEKFEKYPLKKYRNVAKTNAINTYSVFDKKRNTKYFERITSNWIRVFYIG